MSPVTSRTCIYLRDRRPQVYVHPAVFVLGLAAMVAALLLALSGWVHQTRVAETTPALLTWGWLIVTGAGGAFICQGLWVSSPRNEYLGLVMVGVGVVGQVIAVVDTAGASGAYGAIMQAGIAVAFFVRAGILSAQHRAWRAYEDAAARRSDL